MSDPNATIEIETRGKIDLPAARQQIREYADACEWNGVLRLRVIAAFMALVDTTIGGRDYPVTPVKVVLQIYRRPERDLIEFHLDADYADIRSKFPAAHWRLKRVSDELEILERAGCDHVIMRLWSEPRTE